MDKQQLIDQAKQTLEKLYQEHKESGILAIYIWGSITRPDFDVKTSDIDIVCIVSDQFPLSLNEELRDELTKLNPEREWGFQIIYLDELNGGLIRSRLAQAMSPQSILPSFDDWVFASGTKFKRTDFSVQDATIAERMILNISEIEHRFASLSTDDDYRKLRNRKGIVKTCLLLIYNRQLNRTDYFPLDYNELSKRADEKETTVLNDLLSIKRQNAYDDTTFNQHIDSIISFARSVKEEIV